VRVARTVLRKHFLLRRRVWFNTVFATEEEDLLIVAAPDDAVRVLSFIQAHIKVVNALIMVARTLLEQDCQQRTSFRSLLH